MFAFSICSLFITTLAGPQQVAAPAQQPVGQNRLGPLFRLTTDKTTYSPGEPIHVTFEASNPTGKPIVIAIPMADGGFAPHYSLTARRGGEEVRLRPDKKDRVQTMFHGHMGEDRFVVLKPGETRALLRRTLIEEYEPTSRQAQYKPELPLERFEPLHPGAYTLKFYYEFDNSREEQVKFLRYLRKWRAQGKGEELLNRAFSGEREVTTRVEIGVSN